MQGLARIQRVLPENAIPFIAFRMVNVMANIQHRERSMNALPTTGELFAKNS